MSCQSCKHFVRFIYKATGKKNTKTELPSFDTHDGLTWQ